MGIQQETNKQLIQQRMNIFRIPILLIFLVLGIRLWQLQIIQGKEYAVKADNNRVRTVELIAPRGMISDRNGIPLVEHRPSFTVLLYRQSIKDTDSTVDFLAQKLDINPEDIESKLLKSRKSGLYRPIVIKEEAGIEDISIIEAHRRDHPEIQLVPEPLRKYHYDKLAAHLLGYIGEVTEQELDENLFPSADSGSLVGKSGIERICNEYLVGLNGERLLQVDSLGREVEELDVRPPVTGGEVRLTLDLDIQTAAEEALKDKVGAIVAMDPRNGEILAMASAPSFDPNNFATRLSPKDWNALLEDPDSPMQNRSIQNAYSPGSIFKLVMALAGMEEGIIDKRTTFTCTGSETYYGEIRHCSNRYGHGRIGLERAIADSCNIYFYEVGQKLGISRIAEYAKKVGLGEITGVDLPGERMGIVPSPEWKMEAWGEPWYKGETISVSIGQGALSVTPLQILRAVSTIINGGSIVTPHLLRYVENRREELHWPIKQVSLNENSVRRIKEGMWQGVNRAGTGQNAAIPGIDICGKTGTVQVVSRETRKNSPGAAENHAWFAGFSSKDNPEIAVIVFVEHGGKGSVAATLAQGIFRAYYDKGK